MNGLSAEPTDKDTTWGDSDNDFCEFNIIPIIGNICGIYHVIKFIVYFVI